MKNSETYPCLATGRFSARFLRLTQVPDSAFEILSAAQRKPSDRGQVILWAKYEGRKQALGIKLDMETADRLGRRLCEIAEEARQRWQMRRAPQ